MRTCEKCGGIIGEPFELFAGTPCRCLLAPLTGSACAVVGIACSQHTKAILTRVCPESFTVPLLIDPRMSYERSEVYRDRELWRARCKEQAEYDSQTSTPNGRTEPLRGG
jgi:hypothetical protein